MMRSRSRSTPRQMSNYKRSRSRSPLFYARQKYNRYDDYAYRNRGPHKDRDDQRRRDEFRDNRAQNVEERSPPLYKHHSHSPRRGLPQQSHERKKNFYHQRSNWSPHHNSPQVFDHAYQPCRSPTPQRLTTEPLPKENSVFKGPGGTLIDLNELKKITVDIRRNLGRNAAPAGPLRYFFKPEDVVIVRRSGEGSRPIFDREELKPCRDEERVIKLAADQIDRRQSATTSSVAGAVGSQGSASPLPSSFLDNRQPKGDSESDLRLRLMERKNNEEFKERVNNDPNYVPQGRYYYEHDNRERFNRGGGRPLRGGARGFGGGIHRGNFRGNHREVFRGSFLGKQRSPDWKHDMYETVDDDKPSSTTPI